MVDEILSLAKEALGGQVEPSSTGPSSRPAPGCAGRSPRCGPSWSACAGSSETRPVGNGAMRQRAAFARRGEMADVLALLLA